jgi:hypothetical protein
MLNNKVFILYENYPKRQYFCKENGNQLLPIVNRNSTQKVANLLIHIRDKQKSISIEVSLIRLLAYIIHKAISIWALAYKHFEDTLWTNGLDFISEPFLLFHFSKCLYFFATIFRLTRNFYIHFIYHMQFVHTIPPTLYPRSGSRGISDIPTRHPSFKRHIQFVFL